MKLINKFVDWFIKKETNYSFDDNKVYIPCKNFYRLNVKEQESKKISVK